MEISHTYLSNPAAVSLFMDACNQVPQIVRKKEEQKWLILDSRTFSRRCRERLAFRLSNTAANIMFLTTWNLSSSRLPNIHEQQSLTLQ